jgi:hypothetical protein
MSYGRSGARSASLVPLLAHAAAQQIPMNTAGDPTQPAPTSRLVTAPAPPWPSPQDLLGFPAAPDAGLSRSLSLAYTSLTSVLTALRAAPPAAAARRAASPSAAAAGAGHVPYRDSPLTRWLKGPLSTAGALLVLATVSPSPEASGGTPLRGASPYAGQRRAAVQPVCGQRRAAVREREGPARPCREHACTLSSAQNAAAGGIGRRVPGRKEPACERVLASPRVRPRGCVCVRGVPAQAAADTLATLSYVSRLVVGSRADGPAVTATWEVAAGGAPGWDATQGPLQGSLLRAVAGGGGGSAGGGEGERFGSPIPTRASPGSAAASSARGVGCARARRGKPRARACAYCLYGNPGLTSFSPCVWRAHRYSPPSQMAPSLHTSYDPASAARAGAEPTPSSRRAASTPRSAAAASATAASRPASAFAASRAASAAPVSRAASATALAPSAAAPPPRAPSAAASIPAAQLPAQPPGAASPRGGPLSELLASLEGGRGVRDPGPAPSETAAPPSSVGQAGGGAQWMPGLGLERGGRVSEMSGRSGAAWELAATQADQLRAELGAERREAQRLRVRLGR